MRLDAAKTAAYLMYEKPKAQVVVERSREKAASPYSPEWRAKISEASKRAWVRRRRRSAVVAQGLADAGKRQG
jgi:hypothetical protein